MRTQAERRQNTPRSDPLPQTTTRPHRLHNPQKRAPIDIGATPVQATTAVSCLTAPLQASYIALMARSLSRRGSRATSSSRGHLIGNRLALAGTVLYFLEWVGIPFLPATLPTDRLGHNPAATVADYAHHPATIAFVAGWFSVVLLGRIVFVAGLRRALIDSGRERALADVALVVMAVSVTIEVLAYGLVAAGAWLERAHASGNSVVALDTAGSVTDELIFGPIGVSVVEASLAMLLSRLFPRWLTWLGLIGGLLLTVAGIIASSAQGATGTWHSIGSALGGVPVFATWIWIIATSVILWRATPKTDVAPIA